MDISQELQLKYHQLLDELRQIGAFRRGSINTIYRKCGKPRCICTQKDHPGHGPQITLTYKEEGKSRIKNLPSQTAIAVVEKQIGNHHRFSAWRKEWVELNEKICDAKLESALLEDESKEKGDQKKRKNRSSKRSSGKYKH